MDKEYLTDGLDRWGCSTNPESIPFLLNAIEEFINEIEHLEQTNRVLNDRINRLNTAVVDLQKRLDHVERNGITVIDPSEKWR